VTRENIMDDDAPDTPEHDTTADIPDPEDAMLLRVPLRLLATTAEVGRQVTADMWARSWSITREVVEGARQGRSPADLAGVVMDGTLQTVRDVMGIAVEHTPGSSMAQQVAHVAQQLPGTMGDRLSEATRGVTGLSERDVRRQLRQQGQDLLRRSAALDDPDEHPSFSYILRQMAPDEARIVRFLAEEGDQPMIDVVEVNLMTRDAREVAHNVSLVGREAGCIRPHLAPVYLDNLRRLGVVQIRNFQVGGDTAYELLEAQPGVVDLPLPTERLTRQRVIRRSVSLSEFGSQLYDMCFAPDPDEPDPVLGFHD
jgi:hypothetical protein